jgi:hypothetical protein
MITGLPESNSSGDTSCVKISPFTRFSSAGGINSRIATKKKT